jgi:predicted PurR-regulated permease PerM
LQNEFSLKGIRTSPLATNGTDKELKPPFYIKVTVILTGLFVLSWILYYTQAIVIPLVFSVIIAILLHPVVIFFQKIKINRIIAIVITLILAFAVIGALLNVIPYLGGIIGVAIPMMIALITKPSPWYPLYVLAIYYFIQLIDNNFIVPMIVASRVKINALVSIITVPAFGALWGIPGMFLSIPLTAIVKLIFDHIDPLKPWGFLLGDDIPAIGMISISLKKKKSA